ncbi:hypothetical protein BAE44_0005286 [Dichanthelium oligosanthes]|uniref:Uncharacterized protein n=1 Tax=Dichanthelium oligosanthes TaxID=888268 RepID=A0A1E5W8F1_9POAL|nr:hypothetical protein BAE44_0005286 [Dichanthelium oligosanthes]
MGRGGVGPPLMRSWRALAAAVLALWLLPVVLALALLWLPLLCCAVTAVRFQRVRKLRRTSRGCRGRAGSSWREEAVDAGDRARLLHQYLQDQMELVVGAEVEDLDRAP